MPTKKIADPPEHERNGPCRDPKHDPPSMMVYDPGIYEHTCPGCKRRIRFTVRWSGWQ